MVPHMSLRIHTAILSWQVVLHENGWGLIQTPGGGATHWVQKITVILITQSNKRPLYPRALSFLLRNGAGSYSRPRRCFRRRLVESPPPVTMTPETSKGYDLVYIAQVCRRARASLRPSA